MMHFLPRLRPTPRPLRAAMLSALSLPLCWLAACNNESGQSPRADRPAASTSITAAANAGPDPADAVATPSAATPSAAPPMPDASAQPAMPDDAPPEASIASAGAGDARSIGVSGSKTRDEQTDNAASAAQGADASADRRAAAADHPGHRIFTPTTAGPLLVELRILIDGVPLDGALDDFVTGSLAAADADDNGRTRWSEWMDAIGEDANALAGEPVAPGQQRELIRQYDTNRNGHVEADEAARFMARNGGVTAPFALTGTHVYRNQNRNESPLFHSLDRDGDQRLSHHERMAAANRLRGWDQNGDDLLTAVELAALPPTVNAAWRRGNGAGRSDTAIDLSGLTDWKMLGYAMAGMRGATHQAADSFDPYAIVAGLDVDGDGAVSGEEAQELLTVPPHLLLRIDFSTAGAPQPPRLELIACADSLPRQAVDLDPAGRLTLTLPGLRWTLLMNDSPGPKQAMWMYQLRARASEQPDAVAAWLDSNQDGRLTTREIDEAEERLTEVQTDDAPLPANAIPDAYQVRLIRGNPQQDEAMFAAPIHLARATVSRPPWVVAMDANGDGDLSRREFLGKPQQFDALDVSGDGYLDAAEVQP